MEDAMAGRSGATYGIVVQPVDPEVLYQALIARNSHLPIDGTDDSDENWRLAYAAVDALAKDRATRAALGPRVDNLIEIIKTSDSSSRYRLDGGKEWIDPDLLHSAAIEPIPL